MGNSNSNLIIIQNPFSGNKVTKKEDILGLQGVEGFIKRIILFAGKTERKRKLFERFFCGKKEIV